MSDIVKLIFETLPNDKRSIQAMTYDEWEEYVNTRLPNYRPLTEEEAEEGTIEIYTEHYYDGYFEQIE